MPGAGEGHPAPIRAGWVVVRPRFMAYDPGLVSGAVCLDGEFDHGLRQWAAAVRIASLADPFHIPPLDGMPHDVRCHLPASAGVGEAARAVAADLRKTASGPLDLVEVPYPDARAFVDGGCREIPPAWACGPSPVNTRIDYLYRDLGNYKTLNSVVVDGALSEDDVSRVLDACVPGPDSSLFIPYQVGLPEDRGGFTPDADMDAAFFEVDCASFALTVAEPTIAISAPDLVARFDLRRGRWDLPAAEGRLLGLGEHDVPPR